MANIQDKKSPSAIIGLVVIYLILIAFTLLAIYPLVWLFINSFKTTQEFQMNKLGLPGKIEGFSPTFINYVDAWTRENSQY